MDLTPQDPKKKDPDSFSLDPENPDSYKKLTPIDSHQKGFTSTLSPIQSPKLRKIGSFSDEPKQTKSALLIDTNNIPINFRVTLNLCKSFNKEVKTVTKITQSISSLDDSLRSTEHLLKKQEKRIDEFFQEIYDQFVKNFHKMTETYRLNLKGKLQQEFADYKHTHDIIKADFEQLLQNDSFSKLLEHEMYNLVNQNSTNGTSILEDVNHETKMSESYQNFTNFLNNSLELKYGLTPLVKKYKLIEFITGKSSEKSPFSSTISPNISDLKKEPLKTYINIHNELEQFISRICSNFSHELSNIAHPYANVVHSVDRVSKANSKIFTVDSAGKLTANLPATEVFESYALQKRLSQVDGDMSQSAREETKEPGPSLGDFIKDKERKSSADIITDKPKAPSTPRMTTSEAHMSPKMAAATFTPVKTISYKLPKEMEPANAFCTSINKFAEENSELSFKTQLISVHNNLSIGDLVSYNSSPYRIIHKEWTFPQDIIKMVNIFTGEKCEKTYHSRHEKEIEQIFTRKYTIIKICEKYGYYLLMDMGWEKYENIRRLPRVFDIKNVLDKKLAEEIWEAFETNKKVCVHVMTLKDEELIVSYRKEWM
jgi:translation elongation factor P/translation initiation factor 5A